MPMAAGVRVGGVWKNLTSMSVRVGGVWKTVTAAYVRVGGVWKQFYANVVATWAGSALGQPIDATYFEIRAETVNAGVNCESVRVEWQEYLMANGIGPTWTHAYYMDTTPNTNNYNTNFVGSIRRGGTYAAAIRLTPYNGNGGTGQAGNSTVWGGFTYL